MKEIIIETKKHRAIVILLGIVILGLSFSTLFYYLTNNTELVGSMLLAADLSCCERTHTTCGGSSGKNIVQHYQPKAGQTCQAGACDADILDPPCEYGCSGGECNEPPSSGECTIDVHCDDNDPCTTDRCRDKDSSDSWCESFNNYECNETPEIDCYDNSDCDEGNPCLTYMCREAGTLGAYCENFNNYECPAEGVCGDGVCNDNENYAICPTDCESYGGCFYYGCAEANVSSNFTSGECDTAAGLAPTAVATVTIVDSGIEPTEVGGLIFHDREAGCIGTSSPGQGMQKSGTCNFIGAHQSGVCTLSFDIDTYNCGRVQFDAAFARKVFIGQVIDYGIDCDDVVIPGDPVCNDINITLSSNVINEDENTITYSFNANYAGTFQGGSTRTLQKAETVQSETVTFIADYEDLGCQDTITVTSTNAVVSPSPSPSVEPCALITLDVQYSEDLSDNALTTSVSAVGAGDTGRINLCYIPNYPGEDPQTECSDITTTGFSQKTWNRLTEQYTIDASIKAYTSDEELCESDDHTFTVPLIDPTTVTPTPTAIIPTPEPLYKLTKYVRNVSLNDPNFRSETEASPDDIVEFSIWVRGVNGVVKDLKLYDMLPQGLQVVSGTVRISGNKEENGSVFSFSNRLSLGDLNVGETISLLFKAKVDNESFFSGGKTILVNEVRASSSNTPPQIAKARVIVGKKGPGDIETGPPRNIYGPFIFDRDSYKREASLLPIDDLDPIYENEIFIPAIGVRVPIITPGSDIYSTLKQGAAIYPGSAGFGQDGNTVVLGHSFNLPWLSNEYSQIFAHLDKLEVGDLIRIVSGDQVFKYVVTESQIMSVKDANFAVEGDTNSNILYLVSCWPVGSSLNRIVVSAELIE